MKIIETKQEHITNMFPMKVNCHYNADAYGFGYGDKKDYCGSVVEINASDICKHPYFKYPDISGVDYGYICPVCKHFVVIPSKDIPVEVMHAAPEISVVNGYFRGYVNKPNEDKPELTSEVYDTKGKIAENINDFQQKVKLTIDNLIIEGAKAGLTMETIAYIINSMYISEALKYSIENRIRRKEESSDEQSE